MTNQTTKDVRKAALDLWMSLDFSVGKPSGIKAVPGTLGAAIEATQAISPVRDSRESPGGLPLDFFAPSVWHAACFLLASYMGARVTRAPFAADRELFETFYGNRPVYRGQARGWNIVPTGWRFTDQTVVQHQRAVFKELIASYMGPDDAVEFELFGKVVSDQEGDALAQHYGIPTGLVDFTFDPRVAIYFACTDSVGPSPSGLSPALADCAVIYFISFVILSLTGKPTLTFPPAQAERLFRQAGFFVNYGPPPKEIPAVLNYEDPWMWVQQNCGRVFFPRAYPEMEELRELPSPTRHILAPEPFFEEAATRIKALTAEELALRPEAVAASLRSTIKSRPPWRVKALDRSFIYTDEEFVKIVGYIEYYVRVAALLEMNRQPCLDPVVIGKLVEFDAAGLMALKQVSMLPFGGGEELNWICDRIRDSADALSKYISNTL